MQHNVKEKIKAFLEWGGQAVARQDRGTLSNLRRGFNQGTEHRCWPYIARFCDLNNDRERMIWKTVAAGFATHEGSVAAGNLGVTLRHLALEGSTGKAEDALKSFDARFRRLLVCSTSSQVCQRLPGIIRAAKNRNNIPVDYACLFEDLWDWKWGRSKLRWATEYWKHETADQDKE